MSALMSALDIAPNIATPNADTDYWANNEVVTIVFELIMRVENEAQREKKGGF